MEIFHTVAHFGGYGAVFGLILLQKLAASPTRFVGGGLEPRLCLFVTDVASAFLAAAESGERARSIISAQAALRP